MSQITNEMNTSEITIHSADELSQSSASIINHLPPINTNNISRGLSDNPAAIKKRLQRAAHSESRRLSIRTSDAERKRRARRQESMQELSDRQEIDAERTRINRQQESLQQINQRREVDCQRRRLNTIQESLQQANQRRELPN